MSTMQEKLLNINERRSVAALSTVAKEVDSMKRAGNSYESEETAIRELLLAKEPR